MSDLQILLLEDIHVIYRDETYNLLLSTTGAPTGVSESATPTL